MTIYCRKKENEKEEEEEGDEPVKPCKNHPSSVRCFRCLLGAKGTSERKYLIFTS